MLCPMKRGNEGGDFYDQLQMVLEQMQCRDVQIVMADMNAKVMMDNTGREGESGRVRFEVSKWKDLEVRNPFKGISLIK